MNYATHNLEFAKNVHALKMWKHYLMGQIFQLRIDQSGLKYYFWQQTLNSRQVRWLEFLTVYSFDINNINRKENKVSNALSIRVHEIMLKP
jgi:hypothetical protein